MQCGHRVPGGVIVLVIDTLAPGRVEYAFDRRGDTRAPAPCRCCGVWSVNIWSFNLPRRGVRRDHGRWRRPAAKVRCCAGDEDKGAGRRGYHGVIRFERPGRGAAGVDEATVLVLDVLIH